MNDIKNPLNFKIKDTTVVPIDNSPLLRIALVYTSSQYYAAAVDPTTHKNYVLYANIVQTGTQGGPRVTYKDIEDDIEADAVGVYMNKAGIWEAFYKGRNWIWKTEPTPAENPGAIRDNLGRPNRWKRGGAERIPPWFQDKFMPASYEKHNT